MTGNTSLPFGKYAGVPFAKVPTDYLRWTGQECRLSTGLRSAVRDELARRGVALPEPPMAPPRGCGRCGHTGEPRAAWLHQRDGRKAICGECAGCGSWLGALPLTPENVRLADAGTDLAALLTFLIRLGEVGVDVQLVGGRLVYDPPLLPELRGLERQCRGALHTMLTPEPSGDRR